MIASRDSEKANTVLRKVDQPNNPLVNVCEGHSCIRTWRKTVFLSIVPVSHCPSTSP